LPIIASIEVLFWGVKLPLFFYGVRITPERGVKITPIFIWGKNYSHCKFQGVESTQKVLFCNQKRSKNITE
jgi:hypothetical protein